MAKIPKILQTGGTVISYIPKRGSIFLVNFEHQQVKKLPPKYLYYLKYSQYQVLKLYEAILKRGHLQTEKLVSIMKSKYQV